MKLLAGTSKGIFELGTNEFSQKLVSRGVRDLVQIDQRIFAGTGAGIYASDDGGDTWQLSGLPDYEVWQIRGAPDGTLYAGTQPAKLFKSTNQGTSWEEIESFANAPEAADWCIPINPPRPGQARAVVVDQNNTKRLWVGVEVGGIMRSVDAGGTWTLGLPGDNPDLHMMYAHPAKPDVLFASTGYGRLDGIAEMIEGNAGVFRSTDAGLTWQYVWHGVSPRYSRPLCIDPRPPYCLTVASAPTAFSSYKEPGGARAMVFRSNDEGASWQSLCDADHTPSAANFHGLTPDPDHVGGIFIGTDNGEVWRVSETANWECMASKLPAVLSLHASP